MWRVSREYGALKVVILNVYKNSIDIEYVVLALEANY